MDFVALPPEINSARMYAGPGAESMLAAAAAWDELAAELYVTAADCGSVISALTSGPWLGASSASMAGSAAAQVTWLTATAAEAEQAGAQAKAAAAAYEAAFVMTVPPPVIAANRTQWIALIATNFLGQNTPAITATEAHYAEMWAQDATAMYAYAAASAAAASQLTPSTTPPQGTKPGGLTAQNAAVTQAVGTPAGHAQTILSTGQLMSALPQALQQLASPSTTTAVPTGLQGIVNAILNGQLPPVVNSAATLSSFSTLPGMVSNMWATAAAGWGISAASAPPVAKTPAALTLVSAAGLPGGAAVAGMGQAASVHGMSVPPNWATAAPAMRLAAAQAPSTSFAVAGGSGGPFGDMPPFGGAPLTTLTGRGIADSRHHRPRDKDERTPSTNRKIADLLARQRAERTALVAEIEAQQPSRRAP